jgi:hypothetical protein
MKSAVAAALVAGGVMAAATAAQALETLTHSNAITYQIQCVGNCTGANALNTYSAYDVAWDHNSSVSSSQPGLGSSTASAGPGAGLLSLPELKVAATGAPFNGSFYGAAGAYTLGFQRIKWTGSSVDLGVDSFIGTLDYTSTAGFGIIYASLSLIGGDATFDTNLHNTDIGTDLDYYYFNDPFLFGGSGVSCSGPQAIATARFGVNRGALPASDTAVLAPDCGSPTFHLDRGDTFWIAATLAVANYGGGTVDASHTFSVDLNPNLDAATQENLIANLRPISSTAAVPEPSAWFLMLAGFGAMGATLRRRLAAQRVTSPA